MGLQIALVIVNSSTSKQAKSEKKLTSHKG